MSYIGILALQGDYKAHQKKICFLGHHCILVRSLDTLEKVDALVLPGGESTTMTYLLEKYHLWDSRLRVFFSMPILCELFLHRASKSDTVNAITYDAVNRYGWVVFF